jgi:Plasma membrane calcium transporter ATPase C terminal
MPKELGIGAVTVEEMEEEDMVDEADARGQLLWIRGLSRLQHQVRLMNELAFSRVTHQTRNCLIFTMFLFCKCYAVCSNDVRVLLMVFTVSQLII